MSYHPRAICTFFILAATILFLTGGCVKYSIPIPHPPVNVTPPDTTSPGTPSPGGTFSATLGDSAWTANYYTANYYQGRQMFKMTGVANGTNGDSSYVVFYFYTPFRLNQPISTHTADVAYYDLQGKVDWDAGNSSGYGVSYINITAYDTAKHTIAGSFCGTLSNSTPGGNALQTITVKNGTFNVTYVIQP